MKDLGVSHEGFDAEFKPETKRKSWKNTLTSLRTNLLSKRTERAARYTFFLFFPLIFFYYNVIDINFLYACPLIYLLMGALIPPRMAGIALVSTMLHLGVVFSVAWATLMGVVVLKSYFSTKDKLKAVLLFLVFVISLAPLKIGKSAELTNTVATISCYVCVLAFLNIYPFLANGLNLELLISDLASHISQNANVGKQIIQKFPPDLQKLLALLLSSPPGTVKWFTPIVAKLRIPFEIVKFIPNSYAIVGKEAKLVISRDNILITIPPGDWMIELMWSGTGHLGGVRPLYTSAAIAMGFFFLSLLIPPQRFTRFFVQSSIKTLVSHALRTLCNAVSLEKNTCFLLFCSENSLTYFSQDERYIEVFNKGETATQNLREKLDGNFVKASLDEFEINNQFSLSKDIILNESLPSLAKQSVVEISLLKPGLLYWYSMEWQPLLEEVSKILVHAYNVQKLFKENVDDKTLTSYNVMLRTLNMEGVRITQSINANNLNNWIADSGSPFTRYIHATTMVYHINLKMLTPISFFSDCQRHNGKYFCSILQKATTELQKHYGSSDEPFLYLLDKAQCWEEKVIYLGMAWELKQMTRDDPLALSVKINRLTHAMEIDRKPQNILYNIAAFFSSMFLLAFKFFWGIIVLFLPWKWTWKTPDPWIYTKLPWFRSHPFLFCLKWILGVTFLFSLLLFNDSMLVWKLDNGLPYHMKFVFINNMTTKISSWSVLAFLTTFHSTYEGTFRRSLLRLMGMFSGSILGFLCVIIFGKDNKIPQIIWVLLTTFIVCYIGANSVNPLLGFDPSWGYACQLFMYQQGIIIFESFAELQTVQELFFSRVVAHLIGVGTALFISCILFPTSAENCLGFLLKQILNATHQGMLYQSHYVYYSKSTNRNEFPLEKQGQEILTKEAPDNIDTSAFRQTKSILSEKDCQDKMHFFDNLVDEAFENICNYEKEISILKQLDLPFSNHALRKSIMSIKLMIHRHKEFRPYFRNALQYCSVSFCDTIYSLLCELNSIIKFLDNLLVYESMSYYWFTEYLRFFTCRKCQKSYSKENQEDFNVLLGPIKEKLDVMGNVFDNDLQEFYGKNLRHLDLSERPIAELFVAYVMKAYLIDILHIASELGGF